MVVNFNYLDFELETFNSVIQLVTPRMFEDIYNSDLCRDKYSLGDAMIGLAQVSIFSMYTTAFEAEPDVINAFTLWLRHVIENRLKYLCDCVGVAYTDTVLYSFEKIYDRLYL